MTKELKQKICELRNQGLTYKQIQELTGMAKSTISDICRTSGLGQEQAIDLTPELIEKAQLMYDEIGNVKKVAKQLKVSYSRLTKVIKLKSSRKTISKSKSVINWRKRTKIALVEYKGGKCCVCGYNKCIEALEFHHLDPSQKDFQISGNSKSFEHLKQEVDKCILVCSNCHKEIHYMK